MSRRDCLCLFAARGFLIFAVTSIGIGAALSNEQQSPERNRSYYTDPNEQKTSHQFALFTLRRDKPRDTNWAKPNCNQPRDHDEADLCQQIEMSHTAKNTLFVNGFQAVLALLTLVGLVVTGIFAYRAANAAVDAAKHGQTAAEANIRHNALAFRPRLVIRRISLDKWKVGDYGAIQFVVANTGLTICTVVESNATIYLAKEGNLPAIPPYNKNFNSMGSSEIQPGPGMSCKVYTDDPLDAESQNIYGARFYKLVLIGYIVYDGDSGRRHMAFGRVYDPTTERFVECGDPNYEYGD
jgi:hypothetical protein